MRIDYQKAMSKGAKRRISCILVCVFEILHSVQDDKMKMDFYFETPSLYENVMNKSTPVGSRTPIEGTGILYSIH